MTVQTPMERQYNELKKEAGDAILFFRVGDFYEMFHEDAQKASEILDIALTSRNKNAENPVPMCGIPIKAAERYIAKLTQAGEKVAIAEQVSDPTLPGIVERKIISIITPGTTLSDQILEEKKTRLIAACYQENNIFCTVFCELSTGKIFIHSTSEWDEMLREIVKAEVTEIVLTPTHFTELASFFSYFSGILSRNFLPESPALFLQDFFGTTTLKSFGIENNVLVQKTMALLFSYLQDTQKVPMHHFSEIHIIENTNTLRLDPGTISNLELFIGNNGDPKHGLLSAVDFTKTAMGGRAIRQAFLSPFSNKEEIEKRLEKTQWLIENPEYKIALEKALSRVSDIERIIGKLSMQRAIPIDAVRLSESLQALEELFPLLKSLPEESPWKAWADEIISLFEK